MIEKQYDVVIVGTGVAGCFTALHLPKDYKVLMITKADLDESDSFLAQGGICVMKNDEDYDSYFEDTMKAGHYENRKESVDLMIRTSPQVIQELIAYGVEFARDEDGHLLYTREGAHSDKRILYHDDITGQEITTKLLQRVQERDNITLLTKTRMLDLLCRENTCDGILLQEETGIIQPVFARHVMLATGGIGGIYENSTNFPHLTGDALSLSLKYGIRLEHVNYVQIHPTTFYSEKKERRFLISESVRGEGAHLLDKNGQRFVNELLPRDVVSQAIFQQMEKDETKHVWLDMTVIKEFDIAKRFPNIYQHCVEEGYDPKKTPIPVVPAQHYFMGGVYVDLRSHTSMKHLYAAGETACNGVHGRNRLASNSLLESLVFAEKAAQNMVASDVLDRENQRQRFYTSYAEDKSEDIIHRYALDLSDYENLQAFDQENKELIWNEIKREESQDKTEEKLA